jgi:glycosyltransferase involved in cell wall biosynthesis
MSMGQAIAVCFVSNGSCEVTGGQTAYFRALGDTLSGWLPVSGVARFHTALPRSDFHSAETPRDIRRPGWNTRIVAPGGPTRPLLPLVLKLITRPALREIGIGLYTAAFGPALREAVPPETTVVHYVGAGWDLTGHVARAEARRRGIAFVVTPFVHPSQWGDSDLDVAFYDTADVVIACSEAEREYLRGKGATRPEYAITGLGPVATTEGDGRRFRERYGLGDRPLVLFVARKHRYKGYHATRAAMAKVVRDVPDACLVAIGKDVEPPFPDVPEGALLDLGQLATDEAGEQTKADAFAACDVFCMPSEAESFGIVYVEAWSFGKPVIAGNPPAVRELVEDGVTGFRVTDQDEDQIADRIVRLLRDPALARRMGEAGRALRKERYDWDYVSRFHEKVYADALARVAGQRGK